MNKEIDYFLAVDPDVLPLEEILERMKDRKEMEHLFG